MAKINSHALVEAWLDGAWIQIGQVKVKDPDQGLSSPGSFEYDLDYLERQEKALGARDRRAASCRYPVGYEPFEESGWPPFLLDIMPNGAARRSWEQRLQLPSTHRSDWTVLVRGASHPPGNLRIVGALENAPEATSHPGFPRSDIVERAEAFIEYAHQCGAPVSGSTGAGGDSPKFLLRADSGGRWHAEGALPDDRTSSCWLLKFPRTRDPSDRLVLEAEAAYHRVAQRVGVRTFGDLTWEHDCLFVPRFDRVVGAGSVDRLGLESLCSLAGVAEFGSMLPKELLAAAIARHVDDPVGELLEFVRRDVFDVAMGNTDNHARNTSVLKWPDGRIALAPVYDFAPMILDKRGIARVCRWADGADLPRWDVVVDALIKLGVDPTVARTSLHELAAVVGGLPDIMRYCGVPEVVMERCSDRIGWVARSLAEVIP